MNVAAPEMPLVSGICLDLATFCRLFGDYLLLLPFNDDTKNTIQTLILGQVKRTINDNNQITTEYYYKDNFQFTLAQIQTYNLVEVLRRTITNNFKETYDLNLYIYREKMGIKFYLGRVLEPKESCSIHRLRPDSSFALILARLLGKHVDVDLYYLIDE